MFAIEDALADVVARSTQPALGAIKLAWWRERLEELDQGEIPNEPRLQAAADELLPRGVSGADLARLEEGWAGLLSDPIELSLLEEHGAKLFLVGARLLGVDFDDSTIGTAGRLFARVDASRRGLIDMAPGSDRTTAVSMPRRARPLTAFAVLASRDLVKGGTPFEPEGTPSRAWALFQHRLTGRLPR